MISMREKQKAEAVVWLKLMGVREDIRKKFEEENTVRLCSYGYYYPLEGFMKDEIRQIEEERNVTVFLVVRLLTACGELDAFLFVDKYEEDWELEREEIKAGYVMSYTINRNYPMCSELGSICYRTTRDGGIIRLG